MNDPVTLELKVRDGVAVLEVAVEDGYHVYHPSSSEGIAFSIALPDGTPVDASFPDTADGHMSGRFDVTLPVASAEVFVSYQACELDMCLMPVRDRAVRTNGTREPAPTPSDRYLAPDLAPPVRIEAGGAPIDVEIGHAAPFVADFDGDGRDELLVGQFGEGKLRIYRHSGDDPNALEDDFTWFEGKVPSG